VLAVQEALAEPQVSRLAAQLSALERRAGRPVSAEALLQLPSSA
jgi:hypothetical protein